MAKIKNQVQKISIGKIKPSESNPRKSFNDQGIADLAASMAGPAGLLQPITLRRRKDIPADEYQEYEIVAGERRFRAAAYNLGWVEIDAFVRDISDEGMLEIQIIENLQREDVSPIDEAHAFKTLLAKESLEWLASKIHKPKKYILDRLKLNELHEIAAEYVEQGILPLGHAIMISKLPYADQKSAINFCITSNWRSEDQEKYCSKNITDLKEHIIDRFMLHFEKVNFPLDDAELYPEAGPCSTCPKRTCNANLLFQDITNEDKCTDSACFNQKIKLHVDREKTKMKAEHGTVLSGEKSSYSRGEIKVQGVSVKIQDKPNKNSIPVVITKQSGYGRESIGKTVFIAKNALEAAKTKKEETKVSGGGNSQRDWRVEQKKEFIEKTWPRLQQIAAIKQANTQIINAWLKGRMDAYGNTKEWLSFAGVLGLNVQYDTPEKAFDNEDPEFSEMGVVFDRIIEKVPLDLLITYMHLIDQIDDDDDFEDEDEDFSLSWKQMMELINPQPKANGRKKKTADESAV